MGLLQVWEIVKQKQSKAVWVQILQSNSPHLFLQRVHGGQSRRGSEMDMCNVLGETGARETIEIKWGGSRIGPPPLARRMDGERCSPLRTSTTFGDAHSLYVAAEQNVHS